MLLKARSAAKKVSLSDYRATVLELRAKGYTLREVASFLAENGVDADHVRIHRLINQGPVIDANLLADQSDGVVVIGGLPYEARRGRPLRPCGQGELISIKEKLTVILHEDSKGNISNICECQFRLSAAPSLDWLERLHVELDADWDPGIPHQMRSWDNSELRFDGDTMALLCHRAWIERAANAVNDAIIETSLWFCRSKEITSKILKKSDAKLELLRANLTSSTDNAEEVLEGISQEYQKAQKAIDQDFRALRICPPNVKSD